MVGIKQNPSVAIPEHIKGVNLFPKKLYNWNTGIAPNPNNPANHAANTYVSGAKDLVTRA